MTETQIRVVPAADAERYLATDHTVWFQEVPSAAAEEQLIGLDENQRFAAEVDGADPGTYAGIYGVFPLTLAVPGPDVSARPVACAGLTWVGVHPDHRRQGVLSAMIRDHLERVRQQDGVHLSALHASEPAIYGRYGYGLASLQLQVSLGRGTKLTAPHLEGPVTEITTQLASASDPDVAKRMRECHLACADLGSVVGDLGYYARICHQLPEHLRDKEPQRLLFARRDGKDVGFVMFRRAHKWERARPAGELEVSVIVGESAARLALLRRLVDFDLIGTVKVRTVGVDDPLLHWVGGPRATSDIETYDGLWVRIVDLAEALQARSWSSACDVVVDVEDSYAPWNHGTWRIRAGAGGEVTVERTTGEADLDLPVSVLGAAYLGGGNLAAMLRAGLVQERRAGAAAELWRALRTDVAPTAAVGF